MDQGSLRAPPRCAPRGDAPRCAAPRPKTRVRWSYAARRAARLTFPKTLTVRRESPISAFLREMA